MRTTIDLPEPLLRSAKRRAEERKVTLSEVVGDALRADIYAKRPASPPPFKLVTVHGELVDPNLDLNRTSEIFQRDDIAKFQALGLKRRGRRQRG